MLNLSSLLLADTLTIVLPIVAFILGAGIIAVVWVILNKNSIKKSKNKLDETSKRVEEMLESARAESKQLKKEAILEAKEQELKRTLEEMQQRWEASLAENRVVV